MSGPHIVQKHSYIVNVEEGKKYAWCSCGFSKKQPFCDGSHAEQTDLRPVIITAQNSGNVHFCGCKKTSNAPWCDGTHKSL